jgi:glucose/arabinose dehydrogenase
LLSTFSSVLILWPSKSTASPPLRRCGDTDEAILATISAHADLRERVMNRWSFLALAVLIAMPDLAGAQDRIVQTSSGQVRVETIARGLVHPWGLAFLPDEQMLVSERPGRLRLVSRDGGVSAPLAGVPRVFARGQGGLLDVALAPDFASSRWVYLSSQVLQPRFGAYRIPMSGPRSSSKTQSTQK